MRIMITAFLLCALLTGCRSGKEKQEEYDAVMKGYEVNADYLLK